MAYLNGKSFNLFADLRINDKQKQIAERTIEVLTAEDLEGVTAIGAYAFRQCANLYKVTLPNTVTLIDWYAFSNCESLYDITIPNSVTMISGNAFAWCYELAGIELPDSITSIGDEAFYGCEMLYRVTCRATTPPTLGTDVFSGVSDEFTIYVPAESVEAYKTATNWSDYADRIQPIQ